MHSDRDTDPGLSHPRVLVAEDDEQMRQLVAEVLSKDGFLVEEAADGKQLLLRVVEAFLPRRLNSEIDLVVSDVRMPFCSGLDVLKKLRVAHRRLPVLLITAFGDPALEGRARALGAQLLNKPFTARDLKLAARALVSTPSRPV